MDQEIAWKPDATHRHRPANTVQSCLHDIMRPIWKRVMAYQTSFENSLGHLVDAASKAGGTAFFVYRRAIKFRSAMF
ncbi:hypothetical protein [Noviherbaspirillum autotrophicum]|uniref:hypothetical protein n=1 Tax=Noviherbaspirillum autotrophicum TaxID=709839 RepID=UPI0005893E41|nr:hypothetical protein [Noviherbaspirillum autotrophicum]